MDEEFGVLLAGLVQDFLDSPIDIDVDDTELHSVDLLVEVFVLGVESLVK